MGENKIPKITYQSKKKIECPICGEKFFREELLTGRGRLIAGKLDKDLRRQYEKSQRFGKIYPLIYALTVCPSCLYTSFSEDFDIPEKRCKENLFGNRAEREKKIMTLFPELNFNDHRTLDHGVSSYMLGESCYQFFEKKYAPTLKRAICALRCSWTLDDWLQNNHENKGELEKKFKDLRNLFYRKAGQHYQRAIELIQSGNEIIDKIKSYGPDLDKNFGYDGMLYMASFLNLNYSHEKNNEIESQVKTLNQSKKILSRLFGSGKASKEKPSIILDMAKTLYKDIDQKLKNIINDTK